MNTSKTDTLLKCIILISREIELYKEQDNKEYSTDLIKNITDLFSKESKPLMGGETMVADNLIEFINKVLADTESYDANTIVDGLGLMLKDQHTMMNAVIKAIGKEMTPGGMKSSIVNMRTQLNKYYREVEIRKKISKASYDLLTGKFEGSFRDYIDNHIEQIKLLNNKVSDKTPGLVAEIDLEDEDADDKIAMYKEMGSGTSKLRSGFKEFNDMTQGGRSRGSFTIVNALPHHYKSGLSRSLFMHSAMFNEAFMIDKTKKPVLIYISFEDDVETFIRAMYEELYYIEFKKMPNMEEVTAKEMKDYMLSKLKVNGYHIKMLKINPAEWTYKDLFNYILKLEAEGYEIHDLILDYLAKLPPTGCVGKGGVEYRDLFDRVRQFCSPKKIAVLTPHQVSTEAKQLIRNGETHLNLPKLIAEKGYTELSKQLDQVVDLEVCIAKAKMNGGTVLAMQRGKHRGAPIIDDKDKYKIMKFPYKAPIPPNINDGVNVMSDELGFSDDDEDIFL